MKDELQNYMGRPCRYNNIDGTGEMAFGVMLLGYTFLGYMQANLPESSMWRHGLAGMLFFFAAILLMVGLILWFPKAIKKRITWPRTGYVAYRVGGKAWRNALVGVAVLSALIAAGLGCVRRLDPGSIGSALHGWPMWPFLCWGMRSEYTALAGNTRGNG